jgi:delta 1-pyrroline-5-carboxylate dehydrogenase
MNTLRIFNPANGEAIAELAADDEASVAIKAQAARAAQPGWAALPLEERMACLARFRDGVVRDLDLLARIMTHETGKPIRMSRSELNGLLGRIDFFVGMVTPVTATETVFDEGGMVERIEHVPLGVVANISAWNYPWFVGCNVIVPALLTGNAVLYKPSEYATHTGLAIARLLHEAGVPRDVFVPLVGAAPVGAALLAQRIEGARTRPGCASPRPWARASSSCSSSWAARTRPTSATMPIRRPRRNRSPMAPCTTPARVAARSSASTCTSRSTTRSLPPSCRRCRATRWAIP